jgi:hypothetical protein
VLEHQLVVAARLVQREPAAGEHLRAITGNETQALRIHPEQGATHLRALVLEREVQVPRRGPRQVADLALDPDLRERALQQVAGERVQLRGLQYLAIAGEAGQGGAPPGAHSLAPCADSAAPRGLNCLPCSGAPT